VSGGLDSIQKQLLSTFFEEATEALTRIESGLLELDTHVGDPHELINDVFRAAHSIKGGAATFGLTTVAELAHVAETLLDRLRSGRCTMSPEVSTVLLESVDVLRHLLQGTRDEAPSDDSLVIPLKHRLARAIVVRSSASRSRKCSRGSATTPRSTSAMWRPFQNRSSRSSSKKRRGPDALHRSQELQRATRRRASEMPAARSA
jgi:two-component system chemotaxis sensor kinase CheA